jgi:signal transduction histidine kinase
MDEPVSILDPRHSLAARLMWLIIGLAFTFSIAAALWVGSIARTNVLEQHLRRLALETDQLSSDLGQALGARLGAVRTAGAQLQAAESPGTESELSAVFDQLTSAYPEFDWLAMADSDGTLVSAKEPLRKGDRVAARPWFSAGLKGPWIGVIAAQTLAGSSALGDMSAPIADQSGRVIGVIAARLSWRRSPNHPERLTDESDPRITTQAYVLDRNGIVLIGPQEMLGRPWDGAAHSSAAAGAPQFERLPNGRQVLVSRAPLNLGSEQPSLGWQVQLSEPNERVYQRADALEVEILWVAFLLGAVTALVGALGTRHLTGRLQRLTLSVASVGRTEGARIDVPSGRDEVAQLAHAFAKILDDLQQERSELKAMSQELERRVAARTQEVERLAEEARYAAIVRERLKIARDLHDTLAHSMMAILSEIRFLRRLQMHDPAAVPRELARAEEVAHEGLKEVRAAITQMRVTAVRETGLGPALANALKLFIDRTGLSGECSADTQAARFGDERAETLLQMAQEALRNVERHAMATRVLVTLRIRDGTQLELKIEDNGVGFDPDSLPPGHFGLIGLREQAALIGAELRIDSKPQEGTTLSVSLPLSPVRFR